MNNIVLNKLGWGILLKKISDKCQCEEAKNRALEIKPNLGKEKIEQQWRQVESLKQLFFEGYRAPVGELTPLKHILYVASLGQVLDGLELRAIFQLLSAVKKVHIFVHDFSERCSALSRFKSQLYDLPQLHLKIDQSINEDGLLKDDASPKLVEIRNKKRSLRNKIEHTIHGLFQEADYEQYIQDDYFTLRSEKYVVPIRLDGRGRLEGSIVDTSMSGQTLFIEPKEISPLNEKLRDLDLAEKLEINRIFKEICSLIEKDAEILDTNYHQLVELDFLSALGEIASEQRSRSVKITEKPKMHLLGARHPLIKRSDGSLAVANDIVLKEESQILIISGPNAGGKTVVLETVGILHVMAKAGLLIPVEDETEIYLFDSIYLEMGDSQSLSSNLSTFSGHLLGLKNILEKSTAKDLVLLDELAIGTEPQTGSAIAQAVLEQMAKRRIMTFVTTHFDALKSLAISDPIFSNASMEFSVDSLKPTYKLILDVPGQSYGLEVAEQMGLDALVVERAKDLRGRSISSMDEAVSSLMKARDEARAKKEELEKELWNAQFQKNRWQREVAELEETRKTAAQKLVKRYEGELSDLKSNYDIIIAEMKAKQTKAIKEGASEHSIRNAIFDEKKRAKEVIEEYHSKISSINDTYKQKKDLPGKVVPFTDLASGDVIFVVSLGKEATIVRLGSQESEAIEVEMGALKMRTFYRDIRFMRSKNVKKPSNISKASKKKKQNQESKEISFVLQTSTNSVDVRGQDQETALEHVWRFIDAALLRGEASLVIIHGNGSDALKRRLRHELSTDSPYDLYFRAGEDKEGGDGVTIVQLNVS